MDIGYNIPQTGIWIDKRLNMLSTCVLYGLEIRFFICRFLHFLTHLVLGTEGVGPCPSTHLKGVLTPCLPLGRGVGVKEWKQAKRAGSWAQKTVPMSAFTGLDTQTHSLGAKSALGAQLRQSEKGCYSGVGNIKGEAN